MPLVNRRASHVTDLNKVMDTYGAEPCEHLDPYVDTGLPGDVKAFLLIGETDSFGDEYLIFCQECLDGLDEPEMGYCEAKGCKNSMENNDKEVPIFQLRDMDEGSHGRVYVRCGECRDNWLRGEMEEAQKDLERLQEQT